MASRLPNLDELGFGSVDKGMTPAASSAPAVNPTPAPAKGKGLRQLVPQALAGYRGEIVPCGACIHWQSPANCEIVEGAIALEGTCCLAEEGLEEGADEETVEPLLDGDTESTEVD